MAVDTERSSREPLVTRTFVEIADTLVADFDVIDMLTVLASRSVALLDTAAVGILLADPAGHLRVMAASSEAVELLELFQIQNDEGPCLDCYSTGEVVTEDDVDGSGRWPLFAAECRRAGFTAVCAVPLRLRDAVLGCMNLFRVAPPSLPDDDVALAQALADIATIALVQDRVARDASIRESQLQHALESRVVIEQAKGVIAQHAGVGMDVAFARLRAYSRNHNLRLGVVARSVVVGTIDLDSVAVAST